MRNILWYGIYIAAMRIYVEYWTKLIFLDPNTIAFLLHHHFFSWMIACVSSPMYGSTRKYNWYQWIMVSSGNGLCMACVVIVCWSWIGAQVYMLPGEVCNIPTGWLTWVRYARYGTSFRIGSGFVPQGRGISCGIHTKRAALPGALDNLKVFRLVVFPCLTTKIYTDHML